MEINIEQVKKSIENNLCAICLKEGTSKNPLRDNVMLPFSCEGKNGFINTKQHPKCILLSLRKAHEPMSESIKQLLKNNNHLTSATNKNFKMPNESNGVTISDA